MEIHIHSKSSHLSEPFRERVHERLSRMERFGVVIERVDVEVNLEQNPRHGDDAHKVQLTSHGAGPLVRAEAANSDNISAFDLAAEKFELQLRKVHERSKDVKHRSLKEMPLAIPVEEPNNLVSDDYQIVREKSHHAEKLTREQAIDAMEMLDHDFFIFVDTKTNKPSVVYRRRGYSYGIITMENGNG